MPSPYAEYKRRPTLHPSGCPLEITGALLASSLASSMSSWNARLAMALSRGLVDLKQLVRLKPAQQIQDIALALRRLDVIFGKQSVP